MMDVTSPVAGVVNLFFVDDGMQVAEEESLLQVESMKVGFEIKAPKAGTVTLKVTLGQVLKKGDLVATIDG